MSGRPLPELQRLLVGSLRTLGRKPRGEVSFDRTAWFQAEPLSEAYLSAYRDYFGGFVSEVPLTALYPLAQRAQLAMMLEGDFPYAAPGMIHVANDMEVVEPLDSGLGFDLQVGIRPMPETGRLMFEVAIAQADRPRVLCNSLYQPRGVKVSRANRPAPTVLELPPEAHREAWTLPADEGVRYARLSGDYNPIHLSPWLSRWFGFDRPITHGMDAIGRALSGLERALDKPVTSIMANFKKPLYLPASPVFLWHSDDAGTGRFVVESADQAIRHLDGTYSTTPIKVELSLSE